MIHDLILLPWTLFKYIFSLGLWAALIMGCVSYWKFYNLTDKLRNIRVNRSNKTDLDKPEDYII